MYSYTMSENIKFQVVDGEDIYGSRSTAPNTFQIPPSQRGPSMPPSQGGQSYPMPPSQGFPQGSAPSFQAPPTMSANVPFEQQIRQFLQRNKIKLYILTPCFASLCYVNYVLLISFSK